VLGTDRHDSKPVERARAGPNARVLSPREFALSASGEIVEIRPRRVVQEAIEAASAEGACCGVRQLRVLLHAGVTAVWSQVVAAPQDHLDIFDRTVTAVRSRWSGDPDRARAINALLQDLDAEVAATLCLCAERSDTEWIEPVEAISSGVVALMQGTV